MILTLVSFHVVVISGSKHEATSLYGAMSELLMSIITPAHRTDGCGC